MSSYNLYGGTPKKTLDLMKHFKEQSAIYVYNDYFTDLRPHFEATGGKVYDGFYGRNFFLHLKKLLYIIDNEKISIVQTQFSMGENLGFLIKIFRPKIKLVVAFVGPFKPSRLKSLLVSMFYRKVDSFVYISKYVKNEKYKQFSILKKKKGRIILNGTEKRLDNESKVVAMKQFSIFDVAGLVKWKNIQILIEALNIIINIKHRKDIYLYVAGDGPMKNELEALIVKHKLQKYIFLLGYQSNVGRLLNNCDVFVHPSYAEGFGIVIPEAMLAEKPIIVSNAGALPELIENEVSGLVIEPHDAEQWANAILRIIENPKLAGKLAKNGREKALKDFSIEKYAMNYENLYNTLIET